MCQSLARLRSATSAKTHFVRTTAKKRDAKKMQAHKVQSRSLGLAFALRRLKEL